jgi:hypothetical protein
MVPLRIILFSLPPTPGRLPISSFFNQIYQIFVVIGWSFANGKNDRSFFQYKVYDAPFVQPHTPDFSAFIVNRKLLAAGGRGLSSSASIATIIRRRRLPGSRFRSA